MPSVMGMFITFARIGFLLVNYGAYVWGGVKTLVVWLTDYILKVYKQKKSVAIC